MGFASIQCRHDLECCESLITSRGRVLKELKQARNQKVFAFWLRRQTWRLMKKSPKGVVQGEGWMPVNIAMRSLLLPRRFSFLFAQLRAGCLSAPGTPMLWNFGAVLASCMSAKSACQHAV